MNQYNPNIHKRRSMRLKNYDYAQEGLYFITICCKDKMHFFGEIVDNKMILNDIGQVVEQCWHNIPSHFPNVVLHHFVVMPNHIHGVIEIIFNANHHSFMAKNDNLPQQSKQKIHGTSKTIGSIVRGFKTGVTQWARQNTDIYDIWQRNYHDHIIRNETSYLKICEYIENNPLKWQDDCFYS
ncbi:transposase [Moraxella lacunata]|nr:transposase [Moraxella lacunata]